MRTAPERILPGGLRLVAAFVHSGPARRLVHHFKYRGLPQYGELVASLLAERVPSLPLVPVPRVLSRRLRYGVDPALSLATSLSHVLGVPVLRLLGAPLHAPRRAGGDHERTVPVFRLKAESPGPVVLVDDVVTTGATLVGAARIVGQWKARTAVAANVVPLVSPRHPSD